MICFYFLIFLISIDGIISTNSSATPRLLIISSCQVQTIPRSTSRQYYFYFSPLSLSTSSSSSPLLHLSYCEHQQTTSYSSSGFSILYSSSRLPLTDIEDKKHSSSFHHNAVLSAVDQSSSTTRNIIPLMSSSNENQMLANKTDHPMSTTTISTFSNQSFLTTTTIHIENLSFNMILLIGCAIAGIFMMIIVYLIVKLCHRDEGTYKIDESKNFLTKPSTNNLENSGCTGKISSSTHHRQKSSSSNEQKLDNSKEWYV